MACKQDLFDTSFKNIANSHYECIHCAVHIKSSGILRRCAQVAGIKGFD
jgi:hypothetical protein